MSNHPLSSKLWTVGAIVALLAGGLPASALAKTYQVDCGNNGDLQKTIDKADSGDAIEITGICMANIVIRDKALTLRGAASPGPHGITGIAADTDAVRIENSRDTFIEDLSISNPLFTGVRIKYSSNVFMTDCEVSNSWVGAATGIWVQEMSFFVGTRLRLDNNFRGLGAARQSRAFCDECDLNGNRAAATSIDSSLLTLRESVVTGPRGIDARDHSYIDIDCLSHDFDPPHPPHDCSLDVTGTAGRAFGQSTVVFYESGDFSGQVFAFDRSEAQLLGARQQSNPGNNRIDSGSSLRVEPGSSGDSRLIGNTDVTGFSHALFYGAATELAGSLNCDAGGDAWVEGGIDLSGYTISGCTHAP